MVLGLCYDIGVSWDNWDVVKEKLFRHFQLALTTNAVVKSVGVPVLCARVHRDQSWHLYIWKYDQFVHTGGVIVVGDVNHTVIDFNVIYSL